jgi:hypothetical protein
MRNQSKRASVKPRPVHIADLRFSVMQWDGGGGGMAAAVGNAVAGIATGQADYIVVERPGPRAVWPVREGPPHG